MAINYNNKRCENCEHWRKADIYTWCAHEDQAGTWVPKFTCCDKHEFKKAKYTPFSGMKFYLKDKDTGELSINYICEDCGKEFVFTAGEQEFYAEKGFTNEPKRCKECRDKRKAEFASKNKDK